LKNTVFDGLKNPLVHKMSILVNVLEIEATVLEPLLLVLHKFQLHRVQLFLKQLIVASEHIAKDRFELIADDVTLGNLRP
jgi:hypothetical protein